MHFNFFPYILLPIIANFFIYFETCKIYFKQYVMMQGETKPFKPFLHRYRVPFKESGSTEPLWYSIKRASAYIIVLSSYSAYGNELV